MKTRVLLLTALIALLPACSSSGSSGSSAAGTTTAGSPTTAAGTSGTSGSGTPGKVDCTKLKKDAQQLLAVQLLAQLNSPDAITSIKSKSIGNLDLDAFSAAMSDLHALDGRKTPFGDPKAAIDTYEKAAAAAKVLFAKDPITQADADTYMKNVGTAGKFILHQEPIAFALSDAGC